MDGLGVPLFPETSICVHYFLGNWNLASWRLPVPPLPSRFKCISGGRLVSVIATETKHFRRLVGMQLVYI